MSVVDGCGDLVQALLGADGAQRGSGVEVVEAEAEAAAAAQLVHQQGAALLRHVCSGAQRKVRGPADPRRPAR